jgi:hypothetical protein
VPLEGKKTHPHHSCEKATRFRQKSTALGWFQFIKTATQHDIEFIHMNL